MGLLNRLLYRLKEKSLDRHLDRLVKIKEANREPSDSEITVWKAQSKKGNPFGLIHYEVGESLGKILIVIGQQIDGLLQYTKSGTKYVIGDIQHKTINQGIGTEVLRFLEQIAQDRGILTLSGSLSPVDFDHKDKLLHFYNKLGFTIREDESAETSFIPIHKDIG